MLDRTTFLAARVGSLGASQVAEALATTRSGWAASRANIRAQLVAERLTGTPTDSFISPAMQRGMDMEAEARSVYASGAVELVTECEAPGVIRHPLIAGTHASPDGLVGSVGLVELKCCGGARHIEVLTGSEPELKYRTQCHWQLAVTGRDWNDLVYYNPDFPEALRLKVFRIERDDSAISALETDVAEFLAEVDEAEARLRELMLVKEAA